MLFSDCALLAKRPFMVLQSILQVDNLPRRVEHGNGMELASQRTDSGSNRNICSGSAFCIAPPRSNNTFYVFLPSGPGGQIIFANLAPITGSSCPAGVKLRAGVFWVGFKRPHSLKPNTQETIQNYFKIDVLF